MDALYISSIAVSPVNPGEAPPSTGRHHRRTTASEIPASSILPEVRHGQVWRLITPIFLHFSVLHLLFNLLWLFDFGRMIELQRGTWLMLGLVLATAACSNLAQYFWSGPYFGGMSGVVYALFGYIWIKQRYQSQLGLGVNQETTLIMIGWLLICMIGVLGDVANAAHVVGLIAGAVIAYAPIGWRRLARLR